MIYPPIKILQGDLETNKRLFRTGPWVQGQYTTTRDRRVMVGAREWQSLIPEGLTLFERIVDGAIKPEAVEFLPDYSRKERTDNKI
jgi:hypothetical protein